MKCEQATIWFKDFSSAGRRTKPKGCSSTMGRRSLLLCLVMAACLYGSGAQTTVCTQEAVADLVFMVDGSWSIGTENFDQIRQFLYTLVDSFDVSPDHVRVGLVQYSSSPRTEFKLNTFQSKKGILEYIKRLPYRGGGTNTGQGLDFMLNNHFVNPSGSRVEQKVPQIAVVITDGKSQDEVAHHAERLRSRGIILYAIGIKDADENELKQIANRPHSQYVHSVSDFSALQGISQNIVQTLCTTVEEAKRQLQQLSQECAIANKADIVFLVDGSSSIGIPNFQQVRVFLRSVVSGLDIGPDKVRVGLAQFSNEPHKEFLLKDNLDASSLLTAIDTFPYRTGGTKTGKAIDFLISEYFTEEAGSRANQRVPQIAVVITDGDSEDEVEEPAQRLRQKGVIVFAIGVGKANQRELEDIANQPSQRFLFTIDSYQALQRLTKGLLQTVCVSMEDQRQALAEKFADIFFLLDGGMTASQFQQIKSFLIRLSRQLNFGASAYRLGLAQYGQDIRVEFLLNQHQTKQETQAAVSSVQHLRASSTEQRNLGSALAYASANFFTKEAGSRADQGYRQFLVVLSAKDSKDPVFKESRLIKSAGITVVGMSLGASMEELSVVATAPYIYRVNATFVPLLRQIFEAEELETFQSGDCKAAKLADIVFIIDESGSIGVQNFQLVRSFLYSIMNGLEISPSKVRVGIVMYNEKPTAQVYLNSFRTKDELLNFIKILPYRGGGTNTGAALNFTRENIFVTEKGSRKDKGVEQVAVVITDGDSQDAVSEEATELRRAGVTVYSVGVENANYEELMMMASYPPQKHVFIVDSFTKLKSLEQSLQKTLCYNIIRQAVSVGTRSSSIKEGCIQTEEADIFFLIDQSGSIYPADFVDMKKFLLEFIETFRIGPQYVRLGVAKYADSPTLEFDLTTYTDKKTLEEAVQRIQQVGGGTETGKALTFMSQLFKTAMKTRGHKVPDYLVVITDGKSSDEVKAPAEALRAQGVTVYAIGVKSADVQELEEISNDPKRTFFVNDFDALNPIKDDIITDICTTEVCKDVPGDLMFLVDSSGSIYPEDYEKMKDFMKSVISTSFVGQDNVRIGVMQFSSTQEVEFNLNTYFTKNGILEAVDAMRQKGGGTLTGRAISEVSQYFSPAQGGRPELQQRLVVITDGEAQDEVKAPAEALRAKGVLVYAIGVMEANTTQLLEISGSPNRIYAERDFDALKDLERQLSLELCDPERECKKTEQADIIFLVDGSTSITLPKFRSMQKFMQSMVNQTTVGKALTRFGVILYSTNPNSIFTLNQYSTRQEVIQAIAALRSPYGDTYTGRALTYSLQFFSSEHGGRAEQQVPQILMVITDGDATDRYNLAEPSKALRDKGVNVFSIGVEGANVTQLEIMSGHDKSKVFYVDNFDALETLYTNITKELCNSTKPVCEKQQADLVFLIDQSGSIDPKDYTIMKNFTVELVNSFKVSQDLVRVGLAQFSSEFEHGFYLNEFFQEVEVSSKILNLRQLGGGTKIGLALDSIREYFEASRGSRRSSGISQNLVLITDGDSEDDVEDPADRLRALGIEMFAIGVGDVHDLQLLQITGDPRKLFTVQNFGSLDAIKQKVVDTICKSKPSSDPSGELYRSSSLAFGGVALLQTVTIFLQVLVIFSDGLDEDVMLLENESDRLRKSNISALLVVALEGVRNAPQLQMVEFGRGFGYQLPLSIGMPNVEGTILKQIDAVSDRECCNVMCKCSGAEGIRGSRGPPGSKGVRGQKGYAGFPGEEGAAGERGPPGPTGPQGVQGCPGLRGQKGGRGLRGDRGEDGEDGLNGVDGEQGEAGNNGTRGEGGNPGNPGIPGTRGGPGLKGQRGLRGDPGEPGISNTSPGAKGEAGYPGLQGTPGLDGVRGETGSDGNMGLPGRPGNPGSKGATGPKGSKGSEGIQGVSGAQGPRGVRGPPGPGGVPGLHGPQGGPGSAGNKGQVGKLGATGLKGQSGDPGDPGEAGPQGARGAPGPDGSDGFGPPGSPGSKGDAGFPGYPGLLGEDGLQGPKGDPGRRGNRGRPGNSGRPGESGMFGEPGYPGHRGPRGPPGTSPMTECQLVTYIRDNCACSIGQADCPAYPTELLFGLDMSDAVTQAAFDRQRSALLSLLEDIHIAESNCPRGARVAVVGFSSHTKYLIRFQDYRRKTQLIEAVQNIALERTSNKPYLGASMRFVGQNVFKRVRAGTMLRKVAVFFSNGRTEDVDDIVTALMEYRALNIIPAVISLTRSLEIRNAIEVDDSGHSIFTPLLRQDNLVNDLKRIKNCAICYDPCRRSQECSFILDPLPPQQVDVDLAIVLDSSREMQADEYAGAKQLLGSLVEQLDVSSQPRRSGTKARIAVVQQSGTKDARVEFNLQTYQSQAVMKQHLMEKMQQQSRSSVLGQTLDFTLNEVLLKASPARKSRAMLTMVASQTAYMDRERLGYISLKAKCAGVAMFVVAVGDRYNQTQVQQLAGSPTHQHLIHLNRLTAEEQGYVQRFFRVFLSVLNKGRNSYPPASLREICAGLNGQEQGQTSFTEILADAGQPEGEEFQEQTGGQTQTDLLDIIKTPSRGDWHGMDLKARCQLDADMGFPCTDYVQRWFFDRTIAACSPFWFGGCGGNANRFSTEHECFLTCGVQNPSVRLQTKTTSLTKDACLLNQDPGSCQDYTVMWFFDNKQNECQRFWFGGCDGNANRFQTKGDCEKLCLKQIL
ncbi:PREDICTED: collagen alpha-4(VI) chain-like [Cyprinodon variegatus]|uniref:collagen alpha-4(VI) chain-like n=1 Tax=Cyprinodon variegatus TaxID=28743 RepID=UPI00074268CE|nr:PREDICTED: collagen alpha-4(VI) chain-like [Cyprinodon variegatus]